MYDGEENTFSYLISDESTEDGSTWRNIKLKEAREKSKSKKSMKVVNLKDTFKHYPLVKNKKKVSNGVICFWLCFYTLLKHHDNDDMKHIMTLIRKKELAVLGKMLLMIIISNDLFFFSSEKKQQS